jgi:hypothetical protein
MQIFNASSKEGKEIINDGQVVLATRSCTKDRGGVRPVHVWCMLRFSRGRDLAEQLHSRFRVSRAAL